MGRESGYHIKILAKQMKNKSTFSTLITKPIINPWFLTGFCDAESSFSIVVQNVNKPNLKNEWRVRLSFSITLNNKDKAILDNIQTYFNVGKVYALKNLPKSMYKLESFENLHIIIDHFDKYPLVSSKIANYILFKEAFNIVKNKDHLTEKGLKRIMALSGSSNRGYSKRVKEAFPNLEPAEKLIYEFKQISDPNWLSGFVSGDGSFNITITEGSTKIGERVRIRFEIGLHKKETELIIGIAKYLDLLIPSLKGDKEIPYKYIGYINNKTAIQLDISNNSIVIDKIIPFFEKYPILGAKSLDFLAFKTVSNLMKNEEHLTNEGLNKIKAIQNTMNLYDK